MGPPVMSMPFVPAAPGRVASETVASDAPAKVDDAARLRALVEAHHALVWRLVRRLGVAHGDVDDAVQQVFLTASRRIATIAPGRERAFLTGVAVRIAANARRDRTRRREVSFEESGEPVAGRAALPDELFFAKSAREQLDHLLDALPEEQRTIFVLFEFEEMSTAEISKELDIPMGTVASRLRRAREVFQEKLARLQARAAASEGAWR